MAGTILGLPSVFAVFLAPVKSVESSGSDVIVPYSTDPVIINESISNTTYVNNFTINPGWGYVKVTIKNTGPNPITFTVNQSSQTGPQKMFYTVPADKIPHSYYTQGAPWSTGMFFITISSGQKMSGTVGVRLGTNLDDLKNTGNEDWLTISTKKKDMMPYTFIVELKDKSMKKV